MILERTTSVSYIEELNAKIVNLENLIKVYDRKLQELQNESDKNLTACTRSNSNITCSICGEKFMDRNLLLKHRNNKIGLLLCHSHIELRLWLRLS